MKQSYLFKQNNNNHPPPTPPKKKNKNGQLFTYDFFLISYSSLLLVNTKDIHKNNSPETKGEQPSAEQDQSQKN